MLEELMRPAVIFVAGSLIGTAVLPERAMAEDHTMRPPLGSTTTTQPSRPPGARGTPATPAAPAKALTEAEQDLVVSELKRDFSLFEYDAKTRDLVIRHEPSTPKEKEIAEIFKKAVPAERKKVYLKLIREAAKGPGVSQDSLLAVLRILGVKFLIKDGVKRIADDDVVAAYLELLAAPLDRVGTAAVITALRDLRSVRDRKNATLIGKAVLEMVDNDERFSKLDKAVRHQALDTLAGLEAGLAGPLADPGRMTDGTTRITALLRDERLGGREDALQAMRSSGDLRYLSPLIEELAKQDKKDREMLVSLSTLSRATADLKGVPTLVAGLRQIMDENAASAMPNWKGVDTLVDNIAFAHMRHRKAPTARERDAADAAIELLKELKEKSTNPIQIRDHARDAQRSLEARLRLGSLDPKPAPKK